MINDTETAGTATSANAETAKRSKQKPGKTKHTKANAIAVSVLEETAPATEGEGAVTVEQLEQMLQEAFAEARALVGRFDTFMGAAMEHARKVGGLLNRARRLVPHGEWEKWLRRNVSDISLSTALRWMKLAANPSALTDSGDARSKTAAYRVLGLLPERAAARKATNGRAGNKHQAAALEPCPVPQPTESGLPAPKSDDATLDEVAVTAGNTAEGPGQAGQLTVDVGTTTEVEYLRQMDALETMMIALRDPDIVLSPACINRSKQFARALGRFIDAVEKMAQERERDALEDKLPFEDASADGSDLGAAR